MNKITKKSIKAIMDAYRNEASDTILKLTDPKSGEVILETNIKTSLTIPEIGIFVDRVVLPCFDDNGDYMPQYINPLFQIALLQMTTNIPVIMDGIPMKDSNGEDTGEKNLIINIEKTYELCRYIDLRNRVNNPQYKELVDNLWELVGEKLEYMKEISTRKASNSLTVLKPQLDRLLDTFKEDIIDNIKNLSEYLKENTINSIIPFPSKI